MRQHYSIKTFNFTLIIFCLAAIYISSRELFFQTNLTLNNNDSIQIGTIESFNQIVKLKHRNLFTWNDGVKNAAILKNDLIYTHKNSSAKLSLNNGAELNMSQETLLQIDSPDTLKIEDGEVNLNFAKKGVQLKIILGDKSYTLKSDKAKLKIKTSRIDSKFIVESGNLKVINDLDQKETLLKKDQTLVISDLREKVTTKVFQLISPKDQTLLSQTPSKEIVFDIKNELNKKVKLLIANDSKFTSNLLEEKILKSKKIVLNKGEYFWKVKSRDQTSEWEKFTLIYQTPKVILEAPENKKSIEYFDSKLSVDFKWKKIPGIKDYKIEILKEKKIILTKNIFQNEFKWTTSLSGNFSWRIIPLGQFTQSTAPLESNFTLISSKIENKEAIVIKLLKPNQKVNFDWKNSQKSAYSLFQVSNKPDFKDLIISKKVLRSRTSITFPKTGVFYWRTYSINAKGKKVPNNPIKVLIEPTPPPLKPKKLPRLKLKLKSSQYNYFSFFSRAIADTGGHVLLDWPALSDAKTYEIEIFADKELKTKIKTIQSNLSKAKWYAPRAGEFYWRYRYKDFWGRYSPYSERSKLIITAEKKIAKKTKKKMDNKQDKKLVKVLETKEKEKLHLLSLSYSPSQISFEQKQTDSFKIDGQSFYAWKLRYKRQLEHQRFISASLFNAIGSVFNGEKFIKRDIDLNYNFLWKDILPSIGVGLSQLSLYEKSSNAPKFKEFIYSPLILFGGKYLWQKADILGHFQLGIGNLTKINFDISHGFYSFFDIHLNLLLGAEFIRGEIDNSSVKSQQFQVSIGSSFHF